MGKADCESAQLNHRTISLPFTQKGNNAYIKKPVDFRLYVD